MSQTETEPSSADEVTEPEPPESKPESVKPEVVGPREPSTDVAVQEQRNALVEHAAEAALALPGVPGRDEFLALAMQARILSMSGAAPKLVQNNPYIAFHVAMIGRDLGISPSAALNLIDIIDTGQGPQVSLSPLLINGQIRRLGLGRIVAVVQEIDRAVVVALGPRGRLDWRCRSTWPTHSDDCDCSDIIGTTEFTWADAQMAGLVGSVCKPGDHSDNCANKNAARHFRCNQGYKTYPRRMMTWRATGYCADDFFPEASLGSYTAEELGAVVDVEGRPIDPANVDLPEGYEPEKKPPPEEASEEDRSDLDRRRRALPDEARAELHEKWIAKDDQGTPYLHPLAHLPKRQLAKARAVVKSFEDRAAKGEWGEWSPPEPESPETSPETAENRSESDETPAPPPIPPPPASEAPTAPVEEEPEPPSIAAQIHERVEAWDRVEVIRQFTERGLDPPRSLEAQRRRLEAILFDELTKPPSASEPESPAPVAGADDEKPMTLMDAMEEEARRR